MLGRDDEAHIFKCPCVWGHFFISYRSNNLCNTDVTVNLNMHCMHIHMMSIQRLHLQFNSFTRALNIDSFFIGIHVFVIFTRVTFSHYITYSKYVLNLSVQICSLFIASSKVFLLGRDGVTQGDPYSYGIGVLPLTRSKKKTDL